MSASDFKIRIALEQGQPSHSSIRALYSDGLVRALRFGRPCSQTEMRCCTHPQKGLVQQDTSWTTMPSRSDRDRERRQRPTLSTDALDHRSRPMRATSHERKPNTNKQQTNRPTDLKAHMICDMICDMIRDMLCATCDRRGRALARLPRSPSRATENSNQYRSSLSARRNKPTSQHNTPIVTNDTPEVNSRHVRPPRTNENMPASVAGLCFPSGTMGKRNLRTEKNKK